MWDVKQDMIDPTKLIMRVMGSEGTQVREQCVKSNQLRAFLVAFPAFSFSYTSFMPKINVIDCNTKGKTEAYIYLCSLDV